MKIAVLGESSADEAAVAILVEAVVGQRVMREDIPNLRARGWAEVFKILPVVLRTLYFKTDATGLVIVVDSNGTAVHREIGPDSMCDPDCRLCRLREIGRRELQNLTQRPERVPLQCAIGLAVPTIEAWLLSANETGFNEIVWETAKRQTPPREAYTRRHLKVRLYGTDAPSLELETQKMVESMTSVVQGLQKFNNYFPSGAGPLIRDLQSWRE